MTPRAKPAPGSLGSLRHRNRLRILDVLRRAGQASRVDLVRETGLSRTTVSKLVAELQTEGLVVELRDGSAVQPDVPTVGRPPTALSLNPSAGGVAGIDFGHDSLRVAVADLAGDVLAETKLDVDVDHRAPQAIERAAGLVQELLAQASIDRARVLGVGVAVSSPIIRDTGRIASDSILPSWAGLAPGEELGRRLGLPVYVGNDANLGALAEVTRGAGRGARNVVYVMMAAGIGAGLILEGKLFGGNTGMAGELGHVVLEPQGRICRCGNRGCLETVASAPALLAELRPLHGDLTLTEALRLARDGDHGCRRLFADAGRAVGRAVGATCNLVNPELVIVGGDMSVLGDIVVDGVREGILRSTIPTIGQEARVVPGSLGDRAEMLGAIGLVLAETDASVLAAMS